jgi:hypothetical protein
MQSHTGTHTHMTHTRNYVFLYPFIHTCRVQGKSGSTHFLSHFRATQAGETFDGVEERVPGVGVEVGCGDKASMPHSMGLETGGGGGQVVWKAITPHSHGFVLPRDLVSAGIGWRLTTNLFYARSYIHTVSPSP